MYFWERGESCLSRREREGSLSSGFWAEGLWFDVGGGCSIYFWFFLSFLFFSFLFLFFSFLFFFFFSCLKINVFEETLLSFLSFLFPSHFQTNRNTNDLSPSLLHNASNLFWFYYNEWKFSWYFKKKKIGTVSSYNSQLMKERRKRRKQRKRIAERKRKRERRGSVFGEKSFGELSQIGQDKGFLSSFPPSLFFLSS